MSMNVCDYARDMLNTQFEIGKFDCVQMVAKFLRNFIDVPGKFEGYTLNTYRMLYMRHRDKALALAVRWLESFLDEIDYHDMQAGDIAVLSYNFSPIFFGILIGNGKVLIVDENGLQSAFIGFYKIERIFRCRELSHMSPQ